MKTVRKVTPMAQYGVRRAGVLAFGAGVGATAGLASGVLAGSGVTAAWGSRARRNIATNSLTVA